MYPKIFKMVETEYTVKIPERKRMCVCVVYVYQLMHNV